MLFFSCFTCRTIILMSGLTWIIQHHSLLSSASKEIVKNRMTLFLLWDSIVMLLWRRLQRCHCLMSDLWTMATIKFSGWRISVMLAINIVFWRMDLLWIFLILGIWTWTFAICPSSRYLNDYIHEIGAKKGKHIEMQDVYNEFIKELHSFPSAEIIHKC